MSSIHQTSPALLILLPQLQRRTPKIPHPRCSPRSDSSPLRKTAPIPPLKTSLRLFFFFNSSTGNSSDQTNEPLFPQHFPAAQSPPSPASTHLPGSAAPAHTSPPGLLQPRSSATHPRQSLGPERSARRPPPRRSPAPPPRSTRGRGAWRGWVPRAGRGRAA